MLRATNSIALIALSLAVCAGTASARLFDIQAQLRYDLRLTKEAGSAATGDGRFSTNYSLALRRPLLAGSNMLADLNLSSYASNETAQSQDSTTSMLRLYYRKPKYDLLARITRNEYRTAFAGQSSTGSSTSYNASLFVREPSYPTVNLQYLRNVSDSAFAGAKSTYATDTWMLGMFHDLAPFRFAYDRTQQSFGYSAGSKGLTSTQRSSVSLNRTLLPGLDLSGELSRNSVSLGGAGRIASTTLTDRALVRLTATPARAVAASVSYSAQSNDQSPRFTQSGTRTNSLSTSLRAELLPGLALDYSGERQSQTSLGVFGGAFGSTDNRIALNAGLGDQTFVTASLLRSRYDTGTAASNTSQNSAQLSLQTALTPTTDFTASIQSDKSLLGQAGQYESTFLGASLRDRTTQDLSLGLAYRWNRVRSVPGAGQALSIFSNSVDVDALWLATNNLGIDLRLSWYGNEGSTASSVLSPSCNVRWQVAPRTGLSLNYDLQSFQQRDVTGLWLPGYRTKNVSFRLTHAYRSGASLDLSYDFIGTSTGPIEWQKLIRAYVTTRL